MDLHQHATTWLSTATADDFKDIKFSEELDIKTKLKERVVPRFDIQTGRVYQQIIRDDEKLKVESHAIQVVTQK